MDINTQERNILKGYNMLLYFAGSMIMYEPSEECITDFWTKGILKNLPVSSPNPHFMKAASQLRDACPDKDLCRDILREDYVRLFGNIEFPLVPSYESIYKEKEHLNLTNSVLAVTEFYKSYGWEPKFRSQIKYDHLGIELLFLTILVDKHLALDDDACRIEMRKEIRRFIDNHLLSWISKWNEKIQERAKTLCYKGIGSLILSCIEDIDSLLEDNITLSTQTHNLKN